MVQIVNLDPRGEGVEGVRERAFQQMVSGAQGLGQAMDRRRAAQELQRREEEAIKRQEFQAAKDFAYKTGQVMLPESSDTATIPEGPDAQAEYEARQGRLGELQRVAEIGQEMRQPGIAAARSKEKREQEKHEMNLRKIEADMAAKGSAGGSNAELMISGVGMANTKDDAKKVKDAKEMKAKFDRQIGEMINLRKKYGVEYFNREAVGRGKQLSKDVLLTYKNLAKLGVLSKADEDIINAIIPADPLGQDFAPGQDPILHQLTSFKGDIDSDYKNMLDTRMRGGSGSLANQNSAPPKATPKPQGRWANVQGPESPNRPAEIMSNAHANMSIDPASIEKAMSPDRTRYRTERIKQLMQERGR